MIMDDDRSTRIDEVRRTRFLLTLPLLAILLSLILASILLYIANRRGYADIFPLALVLLGIGVIFFGAFYDFGLRNHIKACCWFICNHNLWF